MLNQNPDGVPAVMPVRKASRSAPVQHVSGHSARFDPDFGKTGFALQLFRLRFRTLRLSQVNFAKRFGLSLGSVKDLEQGRVQPSRAMRLLVAVIETDAEMVAKAAETVRG